MTVLLFIFLAFYERNLDYLWGAGIFYLIQIIETAATRCNDYLSHTVSSDHVDGLINNLRSKPPQIAFVIQNYHYETRISHSNGKTRTRRVRVNTHYAKEYFRYYEYYDTSPDSSAISYIKQTRTARINFGKIFNYTPIS